LVTGGWIAGKLFLHFHSFIVNFTSVPAKLWWPAPPEYACQLLLVSGIWEGPTTMCVYSLMGELDPSGLSGGPNHVCQCFSFSYIHRLGHHPKTKECDLAGTPFLADFSRGWWPFSCV